MILSFSLALALLGVPHELGRISVSWPDPARANRLVTADVWYPADSAGVGVPIATPPAGGFPVIAFGHGYLMVTTRYAYLWQALVPEGYVMAMATTGGELFPSHQDFALDLGFLIRRLEQESATPGSLFEGALSPLSAVMGHSMGGGASVLAASYDASIDAVINLAAAETSPSAIAAAPGVTQPSLMIAGSSDCVTPVGQHQAPIHAALSSACKHLVVLAGASHCQFAAQDFFCSLGETGCTASMDRATQQALTVALARSWLGGIFESSGSQWWAFLGALSGPGIASVSGGCNPGPLEYCDSFPNSSGAAARMSIVGSTSISAADLELRASPLPPNRPGIFYYGAAQIALPFGNGLRCVGSGGTGLQRLAIESSGAAGVLAHALDYGAPPTPLGQILPGSAWNFQAWFRDPAAGGANFDLSNGLLLLFEP